MFIITEMADRITDKNPNDLNNALNENPPFNDISFVYMLETSIYKNV
jgi:hypothetical protein